MSNVMKKALALTMALLMIFAVVACAKKDAVDPDPSPTVSDEPTDNGDGNTPSEDTDKDQGGNQKEEINNEGFIEEDQPMLPERQIPLVDGGKAQFVVVSRNILYDELAEEMADALTEKTGTKFLTKTTDQLASSENALYIGVAPKTVLTGDIGKLTYNGYVLREAGSHVHLTGYTKATVQAAIDCLLGAISEEDQGKQSITISSLLFKVHNPKSYPQRKATLLGTSISEYVIVLSRNYTVIDRFVAEDLIKTIGAETGYKLEYYKDNSKNSKATNQIVIGKTSRAYSSTVYEGLATDSYKIKSDGTCVYLAYDNYMMTSDAAAKFCELYRQNPKTLDVTGSLDFSSYMVDRTEGTNLRIMSNNVTVIQDAASYEKANGIEWTDRMDILSQMYLKYMPDFIGLQEMQHATVNDSKNNYYNTFPVKVDMYGALQERLADKYAMLGETSNMEVIFYQKDVWKLEASGKGTFNAMHCWYWGLFSRIDDPNNKVIIMDVHYAGTGTLVNGINNGQRINQVYQELYSQYVGVPIFIMGDFNSKYNVAEGETLSSWIRTFNSTIENTTLDSVSRILRDENGNITSAWGGGYTEKTLNHTMFNYPIDHILIPTDRAEALGYRFINEGLMYMSSGHRPIMADIYIKPLSAGSGSGLGWGSGVTPQN